MYDLTCLNTGLPEDVSRLIAFGDFEHALKIIESRIEGNIPDALKKRLEFEEIRIKRMEKEYIYTFEEALSLAGQKIKDISHSELHMLKDEGYADWAYIDGKVMFHNRFLDNIIKTKLDLADRLIEPAKDTEKIDKLLDDTIDDMIKKGSKSYHIHIKAGIRLKDEGIKFGETVRVHIPIPSMCSQIRDIKILGSSPDIKFTAPADYPQRTAFFEKTVSGKDEFWVEYSYENHVEYRNLNYKKVIENTFDFDIEETAPHIVFSPYLKKLKSEVVGNEKNSLKKARNIYDFITTNVRYSYVREYSTIENIPEYCALNLRGDCGLQALLFITLCRISGIPARWQSGLYVNPYIIGCHDWAQFYIEPYGWLFADPSFGGSAYRKGNIKRWNYYFGNIDPFRMPANSGFQKDLIPERNFLRADPYDNQRGEVEYKDRGLYFDEFEPFMEVVEMHGI